MHRLQDLVRLHRMGEDCRAIARQLKMSPNTERKYRRALEAAGLLVGAVDELPELVHLRSAVEKHLPVPPVAHESSSIERWSEDVRLLLEHGLAPKAIHDRLRQEKPEFAGSYFSVKRLCRRLVRRGGVRPEDVVIRVETAPGEVAQVDFGEVGRMYDPERKALRRAWVFVMVLGFSRHMFAKVVFDQKTETWLQLHAEAFAFFGGVPKVVVPDNLKSAVVRAAFGCSDEPSLNRSYREFARHFAFKVDPTPAYAPKKKGKVESGVKYVKHNALAGREGQDVTMVNAALSQWVQQIAGTRTHGTTGEAPLALFERSERETLLPLPARRWEPVVWKKATVHQDAHVAFEQGLYSVPWRFAGQKVWVRATRSSVTVYSSTDVRIATHSPVAAGQHATVEAHLPEGRRDLRHRSRPYWEERAARMGPEVGGFIREVFDSDDVLLRLRAAQALVTLLERYPVERAAKACARARFFGNYGYAAMKRILERGLDLEPLPAALVRTDEPSERYRFARDVNELWDARIEETHEPH